MPWLIVIHCRAGLLLGLAILVPRALYTTPLGVLLMCCLTSAAVVQDVAGYFCLLGLLTVLGSCRPPKRGGWLSLLLVSALLVTPVSVLWLEILREMPQWITIFGLAGFVAALWASRTGQRSTAESFRAGRATLFVLPLLVGIACWRPPLLVPKTNALQCLMQAYQVPPVTDWVRYYPYFQSNLRPVLDLPLDMVMELKKSMLAEQVVIHDPEHSQSVAVVLNCYVVNPKEIYGHYFMPAIPYLQKYVHQGVHPIYNSGSQLSQEEDEFLRSYSVRYIFVNPGWQDMAQRKLASVPARFQAIYSRNGFSAYEVRQ